MALAHSLFEGSFSVDASKKFIPFDPTIHRAIDRPSSMFIHVHPFLIETSDGLVLCDTGLGLTDLDGELLLHKNIKKLGYETKDVKYVLMSHLHKDHAGGMVSFEEGAGRIAFPDAEYMVQRGEWEDAYSGINKSYRTEIFDVVQRSGNLHLIGGDGIINKEIRYNLSGGHTQYHQTFHIETGEKNYFFGGDVLPKPEEIFQNYSAKYDFDGRRSRELRKDYWNEGAPNDWIYLFYHSKTIAIGIPELQNDGRYTIINIK